MTAFEPPHFCEEMRDALQDPRVPVSYDDKLREYDLVMDGDIGQSIEYCPFCGAELPVSVRREWFRRLRAMGLDPWEDERPPSYQTGEWWRTDPAFLDPRSDGYAIPPIGVRQFVLAMGLDGPVPLMTILSQTRELIGNPLRVPRVTHDALGPMLESGEIAAIHDAHEPSGRWPGSPATVARRLAGVLDDRGPANGAMIPGLDDYETINAISIETSESTHAEAEAWVAEHREVWAMVLADL